VVGREIAVSSEISREVIIATIAEENPVIFRETIADFKTKDRAEVIALVFRTEVEILKIGRDHTEENEEVFSKGTAFIIGTGIAVRDLKDGETEMVALEDGTTEDIIITLGMYGMGTDISIMDRAIITRHPITIHQDMIFIHKDFVMVDTGLIGFMISGAGD
jgi:hypothetical protein